MSFKHCPKCIGIKMHKDGKCLVCGYISSKRESKNSLFGSRKESPTSPKKSSIQSNSRGFGSSNNDTTFYSDYGFGSNGSDCGSSGSDGGSSGGCD